MFLPLSSSQIVLRFGRIQGITSAEQAHRTILAASPDDERVKLRPRMVDQALSHAESEQWRECHEESGLQLRGN
jgi:hypothetical protein